MKTEHGLTRQQELFAQGLVAGFSQADAYRRAYPRAAKHKDAAVWVEASKLAAHPKVRLRVDAAMKRLAEQAELDGAELVREARAIAFSSVANLMHPDGRVKLPMELDKATAAAVKKFKIDDLGRVEYDFHDKNNALERLFKYLGLFEKDNKQKSDPLTALIDSLSGNVVRPVADASDGD